MENTKARGSIVIHIALIIGAIVMAFPFLWMLLTSLKTQGEISAVPIVVLPSAFRWENYQKALDSAPYLLLYKNTILMIIGRIICALLFSSMSAYGFARISFPGNNLLFSIVIIQMMVPAEIFMIPQYQMVSKLNLLNSVFALIFPGLVSAFGAFFMRQQFTSLPYELEEAAILDGCNRWQIYSRIMLPLTKSAMVSLAVFTALFAWKDLMWPIIVNMDMSKLTLSAGLATLKVSLSSNQGALMASSVIATFPMLILYAICQKQFIEGIAQTGMK